MLFIYFLMNRRNYLNIHIPEINTAICTVMVFNADLKFKINFEHTNLNGFSKEMLVFQFGFGRQRLLHHGR